MEIDERRLRGEVVIPQVVMNALKVPHDFSGGSAQSDNGIGVAVVTGTQAGVEIRAGAARGNKNEITRGIGAEERPRVAGAGAFETGGQRRSGYRRLRSQRLQDYRRRRAER